VRLTDSALASDLFPDAYHARVDDERPLPVRWMSLELLETVADRRTIVSEPSADVVSAKPNAEYCMSMSSGGIKTVTMRVVLLTTMLRSYELQRALQRYSCVVKYSSSLLQLISTGATPAVKRGVSNKPAEWTSTRGWVWTVWGRVHLHYRLSLGRVLYPSR